MEQFHRSFVSLTLLLLLLHVLCSSLISHFLHQIDEIESVMTCDSNSVTAANIGATLSRMHQIFVALASKIHTLHEDIKLQKDFYLNFRKVGCNSCVRFVSGTHVCLHTQTCLSGICLVHSTVYIMLSQTTYHCCSQLCLCYPGFC